MGPADLNLPPRRLFGHRLLVDSRCHDYGKAHREQQAGDRKDAYRAEFAGLSVSCLALVTLSDVKHVVARSLPLRSAGVAQVHAVP